MEKAESYFLTGEPLVFFRCSVAFALLATLLSSWKLWVSQDRLFPLIPFIDAGVVLPSGLEGILFMTMCACLIAVFFGRRMTLFASMFTLITAILCFFDQTRLQPWLYEYTALLIICTTIQAKDEDGDERALNACRLILIAVYIWSALQKLNFWFGAEVVPWLFQPILPALTGEPAMWVGYAMAAFELLTGVFLLFKKTRNSGIIMAIVLHASILMLLMHSRWNKVVWPWNLSMIVFIVLLFFRQPKAGVREILIPRTVWHGLALALFLVMPAFNFTGKWDYYLSSALYSGNVPVGRIEMPHSSFLTLPPQVRKAGLVSIDRATLKFEDWSYDELGVPPYPEVRVLDRIGSFASSKLLQGAPCLIQIRTYPHSYQNLFTIKTTRVGKEWDESHPDAAGSGASDDTNRDTKAEDGVQMRQPE